MLSVNRSILFETWESYLTLLAFPVLHLNECLQYTNLLRVHPQVGFWMIIHARFHPSSTFICAHRIAILSSPSSWQGRSAYKMQSHLLSEITFTRLFTTSNSNILYWLPQRWCSIDDTTSRVDKEIRVLSHQFIDNLLWGSVIMLLPAVDTMFGLAGMYIVTICLPL